MNLQANLRKHKGKEGWLEKKSPRLLVGFQKRYFTIGEDTENLFLLYDKNPPTRDKKPKGAIQISQIEKIITKDDSKEFTLKFGERNFVLKAANIELKKEWIETINFLKDYVIEKSGSSDDLSSSTKATWKFEQLDPNRQRNLRLNLEKKNQDEEEIKEIEVKDEQMQKVKGISQYFEKYSEDILQNHIIQGFMYKKKEKFHNKVVQPKKRWFFIFSKFNLTENISNADDFDLDDLPPFINPNVLYYYGQNPDDSKIEGEIHVKNIISINKIDLKQGGDNFIKKGFDMFGNQIISAVNKFTEVTKLDKIGAHIHRFEFIFQIVVKKDTKEVTHNLYSESLVQSEKWVNSLKRIKEMYLAEQAEILQQQKENELNNTETPTEDGQSQQQNGNSNNNVNNNNNQQDSPDKRVSPTSSIENIDLHVKTKEENGQWRNQVVFQQCIKTKERNKLKIGWKDKIFVVKRQIISIYNNDKDLQNGEQEDYILIKDIEKISQEKNPTKFRIEMKKNKQRSLKLKCELDRQLWMNGIQKLMENEDTPLEELKKCPNSSSSNTSSPSKDQAKKDLQQEISINDTKEETDYFKDKNNISQSKSSFQSIDALLYRGYSTTAKPTPENNQRKQSFFSKIFGCCIDPRQNDIDADAESKRPPLQRKLIS